MPQNFNVRNFKTMKSYFLAFIAALVTPFCMGQSLKDVVAHTQPQLNGSARFTAMAGAFGALGGDLTAISQYPASGAVFLHGEMGISGAVLENQTKTNYFGSTLNQSNSNFNIDQLGINFVLNNTQEDSDWGRINIGFNVHKINNFDHQYNAQGNNSQNGLDKYFLHYANGIGLGQIELFENEGITNAYSELGEIYGFGAQQAFLGFHSYVINPATATSENNTYNSNALYSNLFHDYYLKETGYHRKFSLNVGSVYKNNLYLGANINWHTLDHRKFESLNESNYNADSNVSEITFDNELYSYGDGFSMQLGALYTIDKVRLGFSYDSPQWLEMREELQQYIATEHYVSGAPYKDIVAPEYTNLYEPYQLKLPAKLTASFAYVFGKNGLVSVDYSTQNFQNIRFSDQQNSTYFNELNQSISNRFQRTQQLRVGAEYRLKRISLRGGFFSYQSALQQIKDANTGFTSGIGLDLGNKTLNLALVIQQQNAQYNLFDQGLKDSYNLFENITQFVMSYNIKL